MPVERGASPGGRWPDPSRATKGMDVGASGGTYPSPALCSPSCLLFLLGGSLLRRLFHHLRRIVEASLFLGEAARLLSVLGSREGRGWRQLSFPSLRSRGGGFLATGQESLGVKIALRSSLTWWGPNPGIPHPLLYVRNPLDSLLFHFCSPSLTHWDEDNFVFPIKCLRTLFFPPFCLGLFFLMFLFVLGGFFFSAKLWSFYRNFLISWRKLVLPAKSGLVSPESRECFA